MMYTRFYYFQEFIIIIEVVFFSIYFHYFFHNRCRVEDNFYSTIKSINKLKFEKISNMFIAMSRKNL